MKRQRVLSQQGFTLIELMITVAIVAILAAVALPSYKAYVQRGKVTEATSTIADLKIRMEQYYASNRSYCTVSGCAAPPFCPTTAYETPTKSFLISCTNLTATTFKVQAVGEGAMTGFTYTIDQDGVKTSVAWGSTCATTWLTQKAMVCP